MMIFFYQGRGVSATDSDLRLLLGQLHVVEDAKDDSKEVVPPVLLKSVAVALHNLEHDGETSVEKKTSTNTKVFHQNKTNVHNFTQETFLSKAANSNRRENLSEGIIDSAIFSMKLCTLCGKIKTPDA